jgi:periplasmic protein CpxP/Spy
MLKQWLPIVLAAGLITTAAPIVATAQDQSAPPSSSNDQQAPPAQGKGGWHHSAPDPAERTKHLTKQLNLTADQQTKVQGLFQSEQSQMESLRQDSTISQQDRHSKMMDIHKNTDTQVRALLDSTQQKKWDDMQAKRDERMQGHHNGPPSDSGPQSSPPPQ